MQIPFASSRDKHVSFAYFTGLLLIFTEKDRTTNGTFPQTFLEHLSCARYSLGPADVAFTG